MLYWSIKIIIISFILIFLVHHLINYFTSILTIPKEKDLYTSNSQKYELMNNILMEGNKIETNSVDVKNEFKENENNMKDELKNFLKSQMALPATAQNDVIGYTTLENL